MAEQFYTILTAIGKAKMANTTALGTKVNLTKFQVGDGNGTYYNPTEDQTGLKHKTWEGPISSITVDENNPNWIVIEVIIPSNVGGFMIREAGVFDDEGNMIAIGKYPETYKPVASNGSTKDLIIKMILEVSNTSSVTLKVDPTVILATQKDIQTLNNRIENIKFPVKSVNGKTDAIELKAEDIKAKDGTNLEEFKKDVTTQYEDIMNKTINSTGSNSNGNWIKFNDGTLICSTRYKEGKLNISINNKKTYDWVYPCNFISPPTVVGTANLYENQGNVLSSPLKFITNLDTVVSARVVITNGGLNEWGSDKQIANTFIFTGIAIGRWK